MNEGSKRRQNPSEQGQTPLLKAVDKPGLYNSPFSQVDFGMEAGAERILTQQEGLNALNKFLLRKVGFDALGIFSIDLGRGKHRRETGQYQLYLGRLEEGTKNPYYLNISPAHYLGYEPEHLFVTPRVAQVGQRPYYWVEFTEDTSGSPFLSYRLKPDQPVTKIDSKYWRSLEEQLLVDYVQEENGITSSDLRPFSIKLNPKGHPYSLGSVQDLKLNLRGNSQIVGGDKLMVVPQTDPQNLYSWLDIYKRGQEDEEPIKISTYRILQDEKKLAGLGWRNPETLYIVDYLSGNPKVAFDNLRPLRVMLPERHNQISVGSGRDKYFQISIANATDLGIDEVVLIPNQDPKGLYQWVDAYRFNPETGEPFGDVIVSARMIQGIGFERTGWLGAGRQSLIDYSNGKSSFDELLPITLQVGANKKMVDIWGIQKEHVYLTLSVKSDLRTGDSVELVPFSEKNDKVIYKMVKANTELGSYSFDRETKRFSVVELHDVRSIVPQAREQLIEYSQGGATFDDLKPINLKVRKNPRMIDILSKGGMHIYISPSKSFNLSPNDEVVLIPEKESEGNVIFAFVKDGEVLGRYKYDRKIMRFRQHEIARKSVEPKDTGEADEYLRGLVFGEEQL